MIEVSHFQVIYLQGILRSEITYSVKENVLRLPIPLLENLQK